MTYHQTFVDAVRATGGNNGSRTLIIQGPSTSIDRTSEVMTVDKLPKDVIENRLMVEVHFYDPYTYTLLNDVVNWGAEVYPQYYWGDDLATGSDIVHNCGYNAWDTGHEGENNMTIIRRQTEPDGSVFDMDILNIMRHAYGLDDYVNNGITHIDDFGGPTGIEPRSVSARVNLGRIVRVGNRLESGGDIALLDMNGALVHRGTRSLSLENLPLGVYFAKGQGSWVKVNIR